MSQQLFKRSEEVIFDELDDDIVALQVSRGRCYGMENVTAAIWTYLAEPSNLENVCSRLLEQFEVEPAACRSEVSAIIERMIEEGLVEQVSF